MMNTLKAMLGKRSPAGREEAWLYFGQMQKTDFANDRHYTKMLQACQNITEVDGLMEDLDKSSTRPTAAIYTTLHKVYVQMGLFEEAGMVLKTARHEGLLDISDSDRDKPFEIRILDSSTLSAIATNTLRSLCQSAAPTGNGLAREDAEAYFEALTAVGFASAVHYAVMLDSSENMNEVTRWLDHMDSKKVARDEHIYTILHKTMVRLQNFNGAVDCMAEALCGGQITEEAAGASTTSLLLDLVQDGDTSSAWGFFRALRRGRRQYPALLSHYQYNVMLGISAGSHEVRQLVGEMEEDGIPWDAVTYTSLHMALLRCNGQDGWDEAIAVLRRGVDCGLVDADGRSIAATSALKHIMKTHKPRSRRHGDNRGSGKSAHHLYRLCATQAREYVSLLRQAGLADAFQYCFLLRKCSPDALALQSVVDDLVLAGVSESFHICAALHTAYTRVGTMATEARSALVRLRASFDRLHAAREATVDDYNIMMNTCQGTEDVQRLLQQMDEAGVQYDASTFMTCYKVFERAMEYDKALKVLGAAQQEGVLADETVTLTTVNTLRWILRRQGPRAASKWVTCLKAHNAFTKDHAHLLRHGAPRSGTGYGTKKRSETRSLN